MPDVTSAPKHHIATLTLGECESCGAPNRVLHRCVAYGLETSACAECRGDAISDDIGDLRDEINRRAEAGIWEHGMELHAALIEAMSVAICRAVA